MQDIDEKIRHALTAEDQKAIAAIDRGAGLSELMGMSFRGKQLDDDLYVRAWIRRVHRARVRAHTVL